MAKENWKIEGSNDRKMPVDVFFNPQKNAPTVIFVHGYKGYKDWGAWNTMVPHFVQSGMNFIKFNFSHNGGTLEEVIDFPDLDAFSKNTYSKELFDLNKIVEHTRRRLKDENRKDEVYLIGHSRGGGDVILHAARNHNIKKIVTWAAVGNIYERFPKGEELEKWIDEGVRYETNKRTQQEMPVLIDIYTDAHKNKSKFDIMSAASVIDIPWLIIHGDQDEAVNVDEAFQLKTQCPESSLKIYEDTGHTFGTKHPYIAEQMDGIFLDVVKTTIGFLKN